MARLRIPPFLLPFAVFSLVLIVPTFIWLSYNGPEVPRNDEHTSISLAKAYQIGDEVEGGVIMPALGNATAKYVAGSIMPRIGKMLQGLMVRFRI